MRHRVDHRKLNRTASHRKAMLCNMVTSLFASERITTTDAKAKEARRLAERLITRARKGHAAHRGSVEAKESGNENEAQELEAVALAHWRQAGRYVRKTSILKKLFDEIAPQFLEREGGYTRIIKLSNRLGDNARTVMLELIGTEKTSKPMSKGKGDESEGAGKSGSKDKTKSKGGEKTATKTKTKTKSGRGKGGDERKAGGSKVGRGRKKTTVGAKKKKDSEAAKS